MKKELKDYLYYSTNLGNLYLGDNKEILPLINQKINLCLTSPPYNIGQLGAKRRDFFSGDKNKYKNKNKIYDFMNDDLLAEEYISQQRRLLMDIWELIESNGAIFYNHKHRILNGMLDDRKNLITIPIRQEIVWNKSSMINFNGNFFAPNTERIYIMAKPKWKINKEYVGLGEVWTIRNCDKSKHPATFPLKLAELVIVSSTKENDIVLDPYIGSGTTALACERLNRNWIGIEISEKYCKIAKKRISMEADQLKIF